MLALDLLPRWVASLFDTLIGDKGYITFGSLAAAYLAVYGLFDTKSTQEETRASTERILFMTSVNAGNAASFVTAMKTFGDVQAISATEHPNVFGFWQWAQTYQPNRISLLTWARLRLQSCHEDACSLSKGSRLDLTGANLGDAGLSGVDLSGADLRGANLRDADLTSADLSGANLSGANMSGAQLSGAKLMDAKLNSVNLLDANLVAAGLCGADLTPKPLRGGNAARETILQGANLSGADLSGANLGDSGVAVSQAQLDQACGIGTKLSELKLKGDSTVKLTIRPCKEDEWGWEGPPCSK